MSTRTGYKANHAKQAPRKLQTKKTQNHQVPLGRAQSSRTQGPQINGRSPTSDGRVKFSHREFAFDVVSGSTSFQVNRFIPINPGNDELFPWLSTEAEGFESYSVDSLEIEYKPLLPATAPGGVYIAVDYDASDSQPLSKSDMMSYQGAERHSVWDEVVCKLDKKDLQKLPQRYILGDFPPQGTDVRLFNIGNLIIATDGVASSGLIVGEIYVRYTVWLITPQKSVSGTGSLTISSNNSLTAPFTDVTTLQQAGTILTPVPGVPSQFRISEVGRYLFDASNFFSGAATAVQPVIAAIDALNSITNGDGNTQFVNASVQGKWSKIINVVKAPAFFTLNASVAAAGQYAYQLYRLSRYIQGAA